jgi:MGT family glycosyltransferase
MNESIVVMCMGGIGHVQILLPLITGLRSRGCVVRVLTHGDFKAKVEAAGAHFVDLYEHHPLDAVDATSIPVPSRWVTFAGVYAESLSDQVEALAPALIVYDTFTLAGAVVAQRLGIPYVNVCTNHAAVPARMLAMLRQDPRVATSAECWAAVKRLQEDHGMKDASPFSYCEAMSPYLNVYAEPEEFLLAADRPAFEPVAFFGSLSAPTSEREVAPPMFPSPRRGRRVYVSFGTVIWWYFEKAGRAALISISHALADLDIDLLVSLGHYNLDAASRAELARPNVQVVDYVDQLSVLEEADVFITHHGNNSTHEAILHQVPMISYPFFHDQPALARHCQDLGLAVALADTPQVPVEAAPLLFALARLANESERFAARLAEARSWELRTIADRDAVLDRILRFTNA